MSDEEKRKSWWHTLPGILTGVTATISAVAGLLVAINQTGWFARPGAQLTQRDQSPIAVPQAAGGREAGATVMLPQLRQYQLGDFVFTVLGASLSSRNTESGTLSIKVRLLNNKSYPANFWNEQFRLFIDDVPQAPSGSLNELVDGNAAKEGEVTFVVPRTTSTAKLRIQAADEKTDILLGFVRS